MDNQPPFNRELMVPILLGGFSIIGIAVVLLIGRSLSAPREAPMTPSATPFKYLFLGTEPAITTPLIEGSETTPPVEQTSIDVLPGITTPIPRTPTRSSLSTPTRPASLATPLVLQTLNVTNTSGGIIVLSGTPSRTPTATSGTAVTANTYDDTDSRLQYIGTWISQTNVSGAHDGTLHVSTTITNSVTFSFTGNEIHVFYQAGPSLGEIAITIDGLGSSPISQAQDTTQIKEWISGTLTQSTHEIVIAHHDGGSVNIDALYVPAPTPTPTRTPTPTP